MRWLLLLGFLVAACAAGPVETVAETGTLAHLPVIPLEVDGLPLVLAVASTPEQRSQGLRDVTDLGAIDGMLFTWGGSMVASPFNMESTPMALDIAFFDSEGDFVDGFRMEPCPAAPCPSYVAAGPFAYAVETPAGSQPAWSTGSSLTITGIP